MQQGTKQIIKKGKQIYGAWIIYEETEKFQIDIAKEKKILSHSYLGFSLAKYTYKNLSKIQFLLANPTGEEKYH